MYHKKFTAFQYDTYDVNPSEYADIVSHPGKFQGEPAYIPYMWDRLMVWGDPPDYSKSDEVSESLNYTYDPEENDYFDIYGDYGNAPEVYCYTVTRFDVIMFPELAYIVKLWLYENDQGFVQVYDQIDRSVPILEPFMGI